MGAAPILSDGKGSSIGSVGKNSAKTGVARTIEIQGCIRGAVIHDRPSAPSQCKLGTVAIDHNRATGGGGQCSRAKGIDIADRQGSSVSKGATGITIGSRESEISIVGH